MPDLRFAIGAVLAVALLIVAVFGLAATVQVAHHRSATADDPWRTLTFPDPTDWSLLADRSRPATVAKTEVSEGPERPQASVMLTAPASQTTIVVKTSERETSKEAEPQIAQLQETGPQLAESQSAQVAEPQVAKPQVAKLQEAGSQEAGPTTAPQSTVDQPPATVPASPQTASTEAAEPTMAPTEREPVDVVATIPETKAAPVQAAPVQVAPIQPADVSPAIEAPPDDDGPLEASERVGTLPGFPTAGHGFVPPEHPIATPVPLPMSKPAFKKPPKKKVARSRPRLPPAPPPFANTDYQRFGFDRYGPNSRTSYDKKWAVE